VKPWITTTMSPIPRRHHPSQLTRARETRAAARLVLHTALPRDEPLEFSDRRIQLPTENTPAAGVAPAHEQHGIENHRGGSMFDGRCQATTVIELAVVTVAAARLVPAALL
jgi:hypothetical protein